MKQIETVGLRLFTWRFVGAVTAILGYCFVKDRAESDLNTKVLAISGHGLTSCSNVAVRTESPARFCVVCVHELTRGWGGVPRLYVLICTVHQIVVGR